jgi:hypothetical protein
MDHVRASRFRPSPFNEPKRPQSRNKTWLAAESGTAAQNTTSLPSPADGERWERGGYRGGRARGGRSRGVTRGGRRFPNATLSARTKQQTDQTTVIDVDEGDEDGEGDEEEVLGQPEGDTVEEPELETPEERERFYQEVRPDLYDWRSERSRLSNSSLKPATRNARKLLQTGKWTIPSFLSVLRTPSRWSELVRTCVLDSRGTVEKGKTICLNGKLCVYVALVNFALISLKVPGTKRVDHLRAVKMYERAAGDKTLPSDLRPPEVLKVSYYHCVDFGP